MNPILVFFFSSLFFFNISSAQADIYPVRSAENPFRGSRMWVPTQAGQQTSIVMLHGSEGGTASRLDSEANVLATEGYAVLVLCYFDCVRGLTGPKQTLKDVEATVVLKAIEWLRSRPESNGKVVVYGFSRGAELTMLVGSLEATAKNKPDGLIAHAASDVIYGPFNWAWQEYSCWLCKKGNGKCSRESADSDFEWNLSCGPDDPSKLNRQIGAWLINGSKTQSKERIQIEKFDGPILLTVGLKDEVWPVDQTKRLEANLKKAGRNVQTHYFPEDGHKFTAPSELKRKSLALEFLKQFTSSKSLIPNQDK